MTAATLLPSSRAVTLTLSLTAVLLSVASVVGQLAQVAFPGHYVVERLAERFYLDAEANIPTWFSSAEMLGCAALLAAIARIERTVHDRYAGSWAFLSGIFVLLSLDETAQLHEASNRPLTELLHPTGVLLYPWVVLAVPALVGFLFLNLRFLRGLPSPVRRRFLMAGAVYVGGAIGMELVSSGYVTVHGEDLFYATVLATAEEFLEMLGVALFAGSLVAILRGERGPLPATPA